MLNHMTLRKGFKTTNKMLKSSKEKLSSNIPCRRQVVLNSTHLKVISLFERRLRIPRLSVGTHHFKIMYTILSESFRPQKLCLSHVDFADCII